MSDMELKNQTYENKLLWIKTAMLIAGVQAGREYWEISGLEGPFDMDQIAAVKCLDDDGWGDREWDRKFRFVPTDVAEVN